MTAQDKQNPLRDRRPALWHHVLQVLLNGNPDFKTSPACLRIEFGTILFENRSTDGFLICLREGIGPDRCNDRTYLRDMTAMLEDGILMRWQIEAHQARG